MGRCDDWGGRELFCFRDALCHVVGGKEQSSFGVPLTRVVDFVLPPDTRPDGRGAAWGALLLFVLPLAAIRILLALTEERWLTLAFISQV